MPTLVDHFQEKQSEEIWAPVVNLHQMSFTDYETTRRAFKEAYGYVSHSPSLLLSIVMTVLINQLTLYRECLRFKVLNVARSWDNLLWDADNDNWLTIPIFPMVRFCHTKWAAGHSYIVDFQFWGKPIRNLSEWSGHISSWSDSACMSGFDNTHLKADIALDYSITCWAVLQWTRDWH